jgi:hypothetical protein
MKSKVFLAILFLAASDTVYAELSITDQWRLEQAVNKCEKSNNELRYPEYWGDAVTEENKETLCMAEQYSELVVLDGDTWLKDKAVPMIQQCREDANIKKHVYFSCLQENLERVTKAISAPCQKLGAEQLWDEKMCQRLISYIFVLKFEKVLEASKPWGERILSRIDRVKDVAVLRIVFNPVTAIIFLILYVLDVVVLVEPGNWMRASQMGFMAGLAILGNCLAQGGLRYSISGVIMVVLGIAVIWNHINIGDKLNKEIGKSRKAIRS